MSDPREAIVLTEKRLAEVEALQLSLKETQSELSAYGDLLRQQLAALRPAEAPAPKPAVPPRPAGVRPAAPVARPTVAPTRPSSPAPTPPIRRAKPTFTDVDLSDELAESVDLGGDAGREPAGSDAGMASDSGSDSGGSERRTEPRRKGNPVSVQVSNSNNTSEPFQGWVVDRSTGGVRLLVDQEVKPGSVLSLRPTKSHPGFTWVQIKVKSCRPERSSFNLGCQFMRKLTWSELQVFG